MAGTPVVHATGVILYPPPQTAGGCQNKRFTPPVPIRRQPLHGIAIPYFGQDGTYVYVDLVRCYSGKPGNNTFTPSHLISQIPLSGETLHLTSHTFWLGGQRASPIDWMRGKLESAWHSVTHQPAPKHKTTS